MQQTIWALKKKSSDSDISISYPHRGSEVGLLLTSEDYPFWAKQIHVRFRTSNTDTVRLQVRIYAFENAPIAPLDYKLIKEVSSEGSIAQFDLPSLLEIHEPVFISFQWLATEEQRIEIEKANTLREELVRSYVKEKCDACGVTIYDQKQITISTPSGEVIRTVRMKKGDIRLLKAIEKETPKVSFLTTKKEGFTLYRSHSQGKWYKYDQNLIAWVLGNYP